MIRWLVYFEYTYSELGRSTGTASLRGEINLTSEGGSHPSLTMSALGTPCCCRVDTADDGVVVELKVGISAASVFGLLVIIDNAPFRFRTATRAATVKTAMLLTIAATFHTFEVEVSARWSVVD